MTRDLWFCCLLLAAILISQTAANDCVYEVCNCDEMFIYCDQLGLKSIPPLIPKPDGALTNLIFDNNQISEVPAESLPSGLIQVSFTDNPIESIDDHAFDGSANTLQSLSFSSAQFFKFPDAILHIKSLSNLGIYDSNITDWNENVMMHLGSSLQSLILTNVTLTTWPSWLQYFGHLNELSIVNCLLPALPDNAMDALATSLASLTLTGNLLTTVPKALFKLTSLESLYIDMNKITDTTWLPGSNKLGGISLNNNNIFNSAQLSESLQPYANCLTDLDIVNNKLTAIPELKFLTIGSLDLSYNMISDPQSGSLPPGIQGLTIVHNLLPFIPSFISSLTSLIDLSLQSNLIKEIQGTEISKATKFINLAFNLITEITDTSLPKNSSLHTIRLNNNPLSKISAMAFNDLPNLNQIFLGYTRITRLPVGLSYLRGMNMLDFSGIENLVCTCLENSLRPLFMSMSSEIVLGNCGEISVFNFFSLLGSSCPER